MAEIIQYPYPPRGDAVYPPFGRGRGGRSPVHPRDRFVMLFSAGLGRLSRAELTARECRVVFGLLALVGHGSRADVTQAELGRVVGLRQPKVSAVLRRLAEKGVIRKTKTGAWDLGADLVWKGKLGDRKRLMAGGRGNAD